RQVTVADAGGGDPDAHLARPGRHQLDLLQARDAARLAQHRGADHASALARRRGAAGLRGRRRELDRLDLAELGVAVLAELPADAGASVPAERGQMVERRAVDVDL